jgi:hypothetical protein
MAMNRRLLPIAIAAAAAAGCTVTAPTVSFSAICSMPDAATCTFGDKCDAQILFPAEIDLSITNQLFLGMEAHNQARDNSDPSSGRINTRDAYVQEIDVSYAGGALAIPSVASRMQQRVPANGTAVLGILPIPASAGLGPGSLGAGTSTQVIATVKGKGIFGDGSSFETPEFDVPITICNGCLGATPPCADPTQTLYVCPQDGQQPATVACK